MKKRTLQLVWTVVFLLLASCVPYSDHPLTAPGQQAIDRAILGTWFWKEQNETGFIHIGLDGQSGLLHIVMLDFNNDNALDVSEFSGHTSAVGDGKYLNLKWLRPDKDDPTGYMFVKYTVSSDAMGLALIDGAVVEKAITDGKLAGTVTKDGLISAIHITETQQKLQEFFIHNDKALFPESKKLQKLAVPSGG